MHCRYESKCHIKLFGRSPYTCKRQHPVSYTEFEDYGVESLRSFEMDASTTSQATMNTNTLYTVMGSTFSRMSAWKLHVVYLWTIITSIHTLHDCDICCSLIHCHTCMINAYSLEHTPVYLYLNRFCAC